MYNKCDFCNRPICYGCPYLNEDDENTISYDVVKNKEKEGKEND